MTLGARRVGISRPRAYTGDGEHELERAAYAQFAARDRLTDAMLDRMLAGMSTRRYTPTGEPVGSEIEVFPTPANGVVARRPQPRSGRPRALTDELARSHPGAAASLGENSKRC